MQRDERGRPVCTGRWRGVACNTPVRLGYTICLRCKGPLTREQVEAVLVLPENESFRRRFLARCNAYSPWPVIALATLQSRKDGKPHFVWAKSGRFRLSATQPPTHATHWKVGPDGSVHAHLGGIGAADPKVYRYEVAKYDASRISPKTLP